MFVVKRSHHNPILVPEREHPWEAFATFNLSAVKRGCFVYGLYRAISSPDTLQNPAQVSIIGQAKSRDGTHFAERAPFIVPQEDWEKFGCEDPRVTFFEGCYYIFYTALSRYPFSADGIKVAVTVSRDLKKVRERHLVTPFNAKAMALFPARVGGKITAIVTAHTDSPPAKIAIVQADKIEELWSPVFWEEWHSHIDDHVIDPRRTPFDHVEVGAAPLKTKYGWLLVYSHIQNYFPNNQERVFGVEALLLDVDNPQKIIGRTRGPLLVPEQPYELSGYVSNVVFPSGALIEKNDLVIYYGAADTTTCKARVNLMDFLSCLAPQTASRWYPKRSPVNPIILPIADHPWEQKATFNPGALDLHGTVYLFYRALSRDDTSTIGLALSKNGTTITERLPEPIYVPREPFELKKVAGNSGCEDPRLTKIGKRIYMCYTAFDAIGPPRVAVTSIAEKDFRARRFRWEKPQLITPPGVDDKDTCILAEKIGNKYLILHRVGVDICGDYVNSLNFSKERVTKCIKVLGPRSGTWDSEKVGIAAPPIKTKKGWLLLYHAVSKNHHTYRVGATLLDLKDPTIVLARTTEPILWPEEEYEKAGIVNNVVFPCGMVVRHGLLYIYYGGADRVVGVATIRLSILLNALLHGAKL